MSTVGSKHEQRCTLSKRKGKTTLMDNKNKLIIKMHKRLTKMHSHMPKHTRVLLNINDMSSVGFCINTAINRMGEVEVVVANSFKADS